MPKKRFSAEQIVTLLRATAAPNGETIGTDRLDPELRCCSLIGKLRRIPM